MVYILYKKNEKKSSFLGRHITKETNFKENKFLMTLQKIP